MTDTSPLGTVDLLAATSYPSPPVLPPGEGDPLVPLSDPTWDQTVIDWIKDYAGPSAVESPDFLESIEHWRLPVLFPNRYVIFRDVVDSGEDHWRLVRRDIFCHTPDIAVARAFLRRIPADARPSFSFEWNDGNNTARV